jgi:hypothetical protein
LNCDCSQLENAKRKGDVLRYFCPTAGRQIDSGTIVDEDTYQRHRLRILAVSGSHCGKMHRFLMADIEFVVEAA